MNDIDSVPLDISEIPKDIGDRISVTLRNGTIAEFREPTAEDIIQLRKSGITDETELVARIATRCCISWGDKEGVVLPTILKLGIRDFKNISDNLNSFLSPN